MNIMALNLPRNMKKHDLIQMFKKFGFVKSCDVVMDENTEKSKGFAFVDMPNEPEAHEAIKNLHNTQIGHHTIRVKQAKPQDNLED